jgi:molybdate transport system substrate-binding protein
MCSLNCTNISSKSLLKLIAWLVAALFLFQCAIIDAKPLTVAVSSNIKYAFADLQQAFSQSTGIEVKSVFDSSDNITVQIKSGASFDVFLSDDMAYQNSLYKDGVAADAPKVFAKDMLVLWTMKPLNLSKGIQVLNDTTVKKIAVANTDLTPYGREALNALEYFKLRDANERKLIYGDSISQVNQYINSKSVDIGLTSKSSLFAPAVKGEGKWIELPNNSYQPIAQCAVILRFGIIMNPKAARLFLEFMSSPTARGILEKYGYLLP